MNTPEPAKKPRTLFRRILDGFAALGERMARGGMPPPREPKPGEFWTVESGLPNPWATVLAGAKVLEVRDGWVRFERVYDHSSHNLPPTSAIRHEPLSYFRLAFHPPAE